MAAYLNNEDLMPGYKSINRIQTVTASTFDRLVLQGEGPIVVEFMSYGCAHCGVIEPDLQQVAEIVESTEKIFRVNIALDRELADLYEVQGTPTLVMFLNGAIVGRDEGPSPDVSSLLDVVKQPFES
jgi:thioredoxin 1